MLNAGTRMWTGENLHVQHVWKHDASCILGFAEKAWHRDFGKGRQGLSNYVKVLRRVPLPLLRDNLRITLDYRVAWSMSTTSGKIADHRLFDLNYRFHTRLEFDL